MPTIISCPACEKKLRVPDEKLGVVVKCPQCGEKFRAEERRPAKKVKRRPARKKVRPPADDETYADNDAYANDEFNTPPSPRKKKKKKNTSTSGNMEPFIGRWKIIVGVVLAVAAAVGIGGLFSETVAIAATGICIVAIVVFSLSGRIWMAIDLGKESVLQGIGALMIPLIGLALSLQKKGPSLRGAIVYLSMLAPGLLLCLMMLACGPMYAGKAWPFGGSSRSGSEAMNPEKWADIVEKNESEFPADAPITSATCTISVVRGDAMANLSENGENLLSRFSSYIPGSFKVDTAAKTLVFQCKGDNRHARAMGFFLGTSTKTFVRLKE